MKADDLVKTQVDPVVLDIDNMYTCTAACWKNKGQILFAADIKHLLC
jgi:hypothetical protein